MNGQSYQALVVDDESTLRQMMSRALSKEKFQCEEAGDGADAIGRVRRKPYDVFISAMRMPVRDGRDLVEDVLALPNRPSILMLTGVLDPLVARELITLGVDDISFKPIDFPTYAGKVLGIVERRLLARRGEAAYGGKNKRCSFRARITRDSDLVVRIRLGDATLETRGRNLSTGGILVEASSLNVAPIGTPVDVYLQDDEDQFTVTGVIRRLDGDLCGVEFDEFHERSRESTLKSLSRLVTRLQRR